MPDYKLEMKRAIYEKSLKEGEEKDNFLLMMNVLGGRTPQEYIDMTRTRLEKAEQEKAKFNARARVGQDKINLRYDAEVQKVLDTYNQEVESIDSKAPRVAAALENMEKRKKNWDGSQSIEEMWNTINAQDANKKDGSYKRTEAFDNLHEYQQITFESYYNSRKIYESIPGHEQMTPGIKSAIAKRDDAIKDLASKKPDLLSETNPAEKEVEKYRGNIEQMSDFKNGQYEKMLNVKAEKLSAEAKKAGTDLLTQARAEYRNNCNWWERIWANILPSSVYGPAKYVDKINEYKETLQEAGFSKKTIEFADPDKSADYVYNKKEGRYFNTDEISKEIAQETDSFNSKETESSKSLDESLSGYSEVDFDNDETHFLSENVVPSKENSEMQKDFQKGLGELTGANIKSDPDDLSKPKTNSEPQIKQGLVKKD